MVWGVTKARRAFLTADPVFAQRFKRVWPWSEWPGRGGERDTGIDLVAEEVDGGVCAVQCKFYAYRQYITREDIDTFLVASGRRPFTARLFISTTERWSSHAEKVIANQHVPVQRIGVAELEVGPKGVLGGRGHYADLDYFGADDHFEGVEHRSDGFGETGRQPGEAESHETLTADPDGLLIPTGFSQHSQAVLAQPAADRAVEAVDRHQQLPC